MQIEDHFRSLSAEFEALKNRVFNLIGPAHWPTHGGWRESILRSVLRRHLPDNIKVGRGFIIDGESTSTEVDVLLYDATAPVLYKELDLVIVTPNAVRGIIEVKSTIRRGEVGDTLEKLVRNAALAGLPPRREPHYRLALGVFAYDVEVDRNGAAEWLLRDVQQVLIDYRKEPMPQLCFGSDFSLHFWRQRPDEWPDNRSYNHWHLYNLRGLAPGYFVSNVIAALAPDYVIQNRWAWFPNDSKEQYLVASAPAPDPTAGGSATSG